MKKFAAFVLVAVLAVTSLLTVACSAPPIVYLQYNNGSPVEMLQYNDDFELPSPQRDGYVFDGWFLDEDFNKPFTNGSPMENNFHLYAKWIQDVVSERKFKVTFVYNDNSTNDLVVEVVEGDPVAFPATPAQQGYVFTGWYTTLQGNVQWLENQPVQGDITLYAHWTEQQQGGGGQGGGEVPAYVTVSYNANGGSTAQQPQSVVKGNSVILPDAFRSGYTFDGWYTSSSGGTFVGNAGASYVANASVTLYAHWTRQSQTVKGSADDPYNVAEVIAAANNLAADAYSDDVVYVKGTVNGGRNDAATPTQGEQGDWQFCLSDSSTSQKFLVFYASLPANVGSTLQNGDVVVVCGYITNYKGDTPEINTHNNVKGQIVSLVRSGQGGGGQGGGTHTHNFGNNYFAYVQCSCGVWGRNENTSKIITSGDLTYSASRKTQITNSYNSLVRQIQAGGNNSDSAINNYNSFVSYLDDIGNQYQYAQVLYDVYGDAYEDIYYDLYDFYDQMFAWYYNLFAEFYNSDFKDDFYWDYTQNEIQEVLQEAESYGDGTSQSEINEILQEYNNTDSLREISSLYDRFVNANNAIATQAGYSDYMEYAYANEYARDYTPADVAQMRQYVKQYIGSVYEKLAKSNYNAAQSDDAAFYNALYSSTVFGSAVSPSEATRTAVYYISNYFKWLSEPSGIDFYNSANDMFRNGTYFTGSGEGAYTWYIYGKSSPITYFQADSYYDTAFTFVHEFGHYYENVYNQDLTLSMDHNETQSQGDEMLFLAWLSQNKATGIDAGYDKLAAAQLTDMLSTVILSTAVDEFEQAAYSHTYNGSPVGGSNYDYNALFGDILSSYVADDLLDDRYWSRVVFDSAAYYISYAMSALPAVEIYAKAITNGLTSARDSYLKLFTFADQSQFVETDDYGKYILDGVTYEDILHWAGLSSAFEESLYTTIQQIAQ